MAKTEDKSEKEKINYIKSWKILDDNSTLYLSHDNGVDSYEISSISEIEMDFLKSPSFRFFDAFLGIGLVSVIIISVIAAFFNVDPNKNYLEELWLFFPLGILCVYFGIYILSYPVFTFLLHQNDVVGRKIILYSTVEGKKEYKIGCWDYENVMSDDFFKVLFMKSTGINNLLRTKTESFNSRIEAITDFRNKHWQYHPTEENFKFLFISFISIIIYTSWFVYFPQKLELIPLCGANLILLIIEIISIIDTKKSIKRERKAEPRAKEFFRLYEKADDVDIEKNEEKIYLGKLKDIELSAEYSTIGVSFNIEKTNHLIYFESDEEILGSRELNMITSYGLRYYLKQQKDTDKIIYIFRKS